MIDCAPSIIITPVPRPAEGAVHSIHTLTTVMEEEEHAWKGVIGARPVNSGIASWADLSLPL